MTDGTQPPDDSLTPPISGPEGEPASGADVSRWAPDPHDPTRIRWWDGSQWTNHTAPAPAPRPPSPTTATKPATTSWQTPRTGILIASGVIIAGSFGPWATVTSAFGTISISGMDGDGQITAVAAIAIGILALTRKYVAAIIVSFLTAVLAVFELFNVTSNLSGVDSEFAQASTGWGIYLLVGGAVGAFVMSIQAKNKDAERGPTKAPSTS